MIKNNIYELRKRFEEIKKMGWIQSEREGNDGIGRTFETLLGRDENSLEIPDFGEIEIKTKRSYSKSYISLFNMTPSGKYYHEIERLKNTYGYADEKEPNYKVLNNSIFCDVKTKIGRKYWFMLKVDRNDEKIYLCIFDIFGSLIEKSVYWDFDDIKEKLYRKLKTLAFIKAIRKFDNKKEYFKYYDLKIYTLKGFEVFLSLIENGTIRITFKIGIFRSGKRKGEIHDHGTSFDIKEQDLLKLYEFYQDNFFITN